MSDPIGPTSPAGDLQRLAALRRRAVSQLPGAAGTDTATANTAADALVVLHAMASSPATAPEALALLHELQVHQVELDLQAQELRDERGELEAALHLQAERHEHLPVGCLTVDAELVVRELNRRAAGLMGVDALHAVGLPLAGFVAGDSLQHLRAATADVDAGRAPATCRMVLRAPPGAGRAVRAHVGADPAARGYLVALTNDAEAADDTVR